MKKEIAGKIRKSYHKKNKWVQQCLAVIFCICMSISIELGNTMICFADANTSFAESD